MRRISSKSATRCMFESHVIHRPSVRSTVRYTINGLNGPSSDPSSSLRYYCFFNRGPAATGRVVIEEEKEAAQERVTQRHCAEAQPVGRTRGVDRLASLG